MKKKHIIFIFSGLLFFLSNFPPLKYVFDLSIDSEYHKYSNYNGTFTFVEFKGHNYEMMKRVYSEFKKTNSTKEDTTLYRVFSKNYFCFWRWKDYYEDKRFLLPYKSWSIIRHNRGYDLVFSNNYQDF